MANIHRIRSNFKQGTLGANLLTTVTTIDFGSDPGFATLGTDEYIPIVIDPEGAAQGPEIVYLTAYTATNTTGTIERGKEGTSDPGVTHPSGTAWIHGPTARDNDWAPWALSLHEPLAVATLDIDIAGYEAVRLVGWLVPATDDVELGIRFSNDGGSTFRAAVGNYGTALRRLSTDGALNLTTTDETSTSIRLALGVGSAAGEMARIDINILNPSKADTETTIYHTTNYDHKDSHRTYAFGGGFVLAAKEVNNAVRLLFSSGNIESGRVTVYGYPAAE